MDHPKALYTPSTISYHPSAGFVVCGDDGEAIFVGWGIDFGGFFRDVGRGIAKAANTVASTVEKGAKWVVQHDPLAQTIKAVAEGKRLDRALLEGGKVTVEALKEAGPYAQAVLSVIPGVGTGVSVALGTAIALANGKPISEVAIQAARSAVPGGPIAQAAFDTAVGLAKGQRIDDALLGAARSRLPEAAKAAFDTGLALARGAKIQEAVTLGARRLLPKGAQDGFDVAVSMLNGKKPTDALLAAARQRLPADAKLAFDAAVSIAKSGRPDALATLAKTAAAKALEQRTQSTLQNASATAMDVLRAAENKLSGPLSRARIPYAVAKQLPGIPEASRIVVRAVQGDLIAKQFVANAYRGAQRGDPRLLGAYQKLQLAKNLQRHGELRVRRRLRPEEVERLVQIVRRAMAKGAA